MEYKVIDITNFKEDEKIEIERVLHQIRMRRKNRAWKPEYKESYYYIDSLNRICKDSWDNAVGDETRLNIGNVFMTKEEANFATEKKKVKAELERYALEHNDPEEEAWNNDNGHYMIAFSHRANDLFITRGYYIEEESATYFTSWKIAREAMTTIGEERIKKYIFNMECEK